MAQNKRTPGAGTPKALEDVALRADTLPVALSFLQSQIRRIQVQYGLSYERAAVEAGHCYGVADDWRTRA